MNPQAIVAEIRAALQRMPEQLRAEVNQEVLELRAVVNDLAQRGGGGFVPQGGASAESELIKAITEHDGFKQLANGGAGGCKIKVPPRLLYRNAIINPAPGVADPLRQPDRSLGIVTPPERRMTIRGLFMLRSIASGSVDVMQEATYTSNAAIQGNDESPTGSGEGALKAESQMTFTSSTLNVPTIAHHIVASKQILDDVAWLRLHIEARLLYGLALEEESEMLTGTGTGLSMNGINNQAASFTGGVTNATALDTLARAINQLQLSNFEPSGIILHPTDWLAIKLLKDNDNRYLLGDPAQMTMPSLWGLPVIPTSSQTLGNFTVLDARQAGYIADREDANVSMNFVNDQFVRNLITILAEERSVIVIERPTAMVYGVLSHTG